MGSSSTKAIRLIVNADDFGASQQVNEAVIRAHREGVLTSCSLMVTGEAFEQAVAMAKEHPSLAVGLHLVVVMGRSVLPPAVIPNLVDEHGYFSNNPLSTGLKYYFSKPAQAELEKELTAQFERFHRTQLPFSHIDGHLHMHAHPVVFKLAMKLGRQFKVQRMRVPQEELGLALRFSAEHFFRKTLHALFFRCLSGHMKRRLREKQFLFSDRVYGTLQTGELNLQYLLFLLKNLNSESNEIHCHPAIFQTTSLNVRQQCQAAEFEALTDPKVREFLNTSIIQLTNYFELESCK